MKIHNGVYESLSFSYCNKLRVVRNNMDAFANYLQELASTGVMSGKAHDSVVLFAGYVKQVPKLIDVLDAKFNSLIKSYIDDMNRAQRRNGEYILYDKEYVGVRDYSEEEFSYLMQICDSSDRDANIFSEIADHIANLFSRAASFLQRALSYPSVRQTQRNVMEANDITRRILRDIKNELYYQESYYSGVARNIESYIDSILQFTNLLQETVSGTVEDFMSESCVIKISDAYSDAVEKGKSLDFGERVTKADIEAFANSSDSDVFLKEQVRVIRKFLGNQANNMRWDRPDFWSAVFFQQFDIAKNRIKYMFNKEYDYNDFLLEREMVSVIAEASDFELFDDSSEKKFLDQYGDLMKSLEKYGSNWEKYLAGARDSNGKPLIDVKSPEFTDFKKVVDSFGGAEKIIEQGTDFCDYLVKICADYSKNLSVLDAVERNFSDNEEMAECFKRLRAQYEKEFSSFCKEIYDDVADKGIDIIGEFLLGKTVFSLVSFAEKSYGVIGELTGEGEASEARVELMAYGYDQLESAEGSFKQSLQALRACDPSSELYDQCLKDVNVNFEYYRISQRRLFEKMANACDGTEKDYYIYCANQIDRITICNYSDYHIMSYEEYVTGNPGGGGFR